MKDPRRPKPPGYYFKPETRCKYNIFPPPGFIMVQCSRLKGHGPNKDWCKQHAKKVQAKMDLEKKNLEAMR